VWRAFISRADPLFLGSPPYPRGYLNTPREKFSPVTTQWVPPPQILPTRWGPQPCVRRPTHFGWSREPPLDCSVRNSPKKSPFAVCVSRFHVLAPLWKQKGLLPLARKRWAHKPPPVGKTPTRVRPCARKRINSARPKKETGSPFIRSPPTPGAHNDPLGEPLKPNERPRNPKPPEPRCPHPRVWPKEIFGAPLYLASERFRCTSAHF